jgi:hydroxyatrazine ethylaminohydrolase
MGVGEYVDLTMINGKFVWRNGELVGLDEKKLTFDAVAHLNRVVYEI